MWSVHIFILVCLRFWLCSFQCVRVFSLCLFKKSLKIPKEVIRIRISKKNRQHYGQKKKYKRTNNDLQNIHIRSSNTNMISHEWGKDREVFTTSGTYPWLFVILIYKCITFMYFNNWLLCRAHSWQFSLIVDILFCDILYLY